MDVQIITYITNLHGSYRTLEENFLKTQFETTTVRHLDFLIQLINEFEEKLDYQKRYKKKDPRIEKYFDAIEVCFGVIKKSFSNESGEYINYTYKWSNPEKRSALVAAFNKGKEELRTANNAVGSLFKEVKEIENGTPVYGYSDYSGKPLTKSDVVLSRVFGGFFVLFFAACLIVGIIAVVKDLFANLATTFYVLGVITAIFLILFIIDLIIRKRK